MSPKSVLVIGGYGFLGSTIADAFEQEGWQVRRGSRALRDSAAVLVELSDPDTIRKAAQGVDMVVNTVPDPHLSAESVILHSGGMLLNVATIDQPPVRAFRDHARQNSPSGTVVVNAGLAPGVTNLVIADLLQRHPHADGVEIAMALQTKGMSGKSGVHFVYENLVTGRRNGVQIRHHDTARIPLPEPFGTRPCFGFGEGQGGWLLGSAGERTLHTFGYLDDKTLHTAILGLNALRLLPLLPIAPLLAGHSRRPDTATTEPVAHWLAVYHEGSRIDARTVRCAGDYLCTGAATVETAEALLRAGASIPAGCFGIEELLTLNDIERELKHHGITVADELGPRTDASPSHAPGR